MVCGHLNLARLLLVPRGSGQGTNGRAAIELVCKALRGTVQSIAESLS